MQSNLPFDTTFAHSYQWAEPERDLPIVLEIIQGHMEGTCPVNSDEHYEIQSLLASNPNTPAPLLAHIAKCTQSAKILERLANNPAVSQSTLRQLAGHESCEVRMAVAESSNADYETIELLANDPHTDVRFRLAENPSLPSDILNQLCQDENPYVAYRAQMTRYRISSTPGITQAFPDKQNLRPRRVS